VSLVARHLESNGIPTVIAGSALDVVEYCGVPRFLYTDFPLGNPCGKPYDTTMQREIVGVALDLLESATAPRTTVQTCYTWSSGEQWRENFLRVDPEEREALLALGEQRRSRQKQRKGGGGRAEQLA